MKNANIPKSAAIVGNADAMIVVSSACSVNGIIKPKMILYRYARCRFLFSAFSSAVCRSLAPSSLPRTDEVGLQSPCIGGGVLVPTAVGLVGVVLRGNSSASREELAFRF